MKAILLALLLSGCASTCETCLTLTPGQLGAAMQKAWVNGYGKGFDAGEDTEQLRRLRAL